MSLQMTWRQEIPADTARIGQAILAEGNAYRLVAEQVSGFVSLADFSELYSEQGRGAICPITLALVTIFQFLENVPDRVAAEWVVTRLDWKYALHLPLTALGFHFSDLSNFRARLLEHGAERLVFEKILNWVRARGLLKKHGKQRSDSTHIVGCVERLSRLELAWETLRVGLRALQAVAPDWYVAVIPAVFHAAYVDRHSDWRLSPAEAARALQQVGGDGFWLLDRVNESAPEAVRLLPELVTLRQVWVQQFERQPDSQPVKVRSSRRRGQGKDTLVSPHDPQARWSEKRGQSWLGYRLEVTETAEDDVSTQFITDIDSVAANVYDSETLEAIQTRLISRDLKPTQHYVDEGYTSGANLVHSAQRGIELLGPVSLDTAGKPPGYCQSDFDLDFEAQQATCPMGKTSAAWYERLQPDGYVGAEIQFKGRCVGCPVRAQCAPGKSGRTLHINPYHTCLNQRRAEQQTPAFQDKMKHRPAIEGTISELTRVHGARRARYRGSAKVRLQMLCAGAALNLKRALRSLVAQKRAALSATAGA